MNRDEKEEAAVLAHNDPEAKNPVAIVADTPCAVKPNTLRDIMAAAQMSPREVISTVRELFPSFDKSMLSKCMKPEKYGIVIHPIALAAISGTTQNHNSEKGETGMTQNERILRHFKDYGSITSLEAMKEYGIMRLASRISDLRKLGYEITVTTEKSKNRYGEPTSYARYSLEVHDDV